MLFGSNFAVTVIFQGKGGLDIRLDRRICLLVLERDLENVTHQLGHSYISFCTSFKIFHVLLLCKRPCFGLLYCSLIIIISQVNFISYEDHGDPLVLVFEDAIYPVTRVQERIVERQIEGDYHTVGIFKETVC